MLEALDRLGVHLPSLLIYAVNFLVLWGVLHLVAFRPFVRKLRERAQEEDRWKEEKQRVSELSQEASQARETALAEGRRERDAMLQAAADQGESYVNEGVARARERAQAELARAREQIQLESTRAYQALHEAFVELVLEAAARALGRALDEEEHQKLIVEATRELSGLDWLSLPRQSLGFAIVTTAVPMTSRQQKCISDFLAETARREVKIVYRVDPSVVGGISVRTGDTLVDATLEGRLERLRRYLLSLQDPNKH